MKELELELKKMLIEALDLEDISADDIDSAAPLFGEGLGLDSIDALEIGLEVQRRYGIQLDAEDESTREHFSSVANLALLVTSTRTKGA
jgi:acyl carrier protein